MGDDEVTTEPEAVADEAETSPPAEEPAVVEAPDLERRVSDLESAILALGGADRIPTL